jgi:TctA family transporter
MKLDPFSLVISIIALAVFFVPVIYDQIKKKKAKESEQNHG